ncbi:Multifunctional non-homologous end joining protein LigD [Cupriavidus pinatubonensis]|uniref:Multifunctional non-homologous end joining protein LigD n=1 Tax=Cupriavidus pinatubonensis TaxID=248026 RepID=A0ABN7YAJ6_9BURK|nr:Multifunctional non-homologous end joining protein LigD [Cupriavidus pinatubonensis]
MLAATSPVALKTRGGVDATGWFPELVAALSSLPAGAHILDGEVAVLDEIGRSDFNRVHARALRRRWYTGADPVILCAFDLLAHKGQDIRALPIEERKRRLRVLLAGVERGILFVDSDPDGEWLFSAVFSLKLEGVVAKRAGSAYVAGESPDWLKIKCPGAVQQGSFHRSI